jgi:hypothetical protein
MPVSDGMEKNAPSQAAGAEEVIDASFENVTVSGLFALPLAPMMRGVVRVWVEPEVDVAKDQLTSLVEDVHPLCAVVRLDVVYPVPYVVLVGRLTPVNVTGYGLGLAMVTTTSPTPPG